MSSARFTCPDSRSFNGAAALVIALLLFPAPASRAVEKAERPYFSEGFEQAQRTAFRYEWKYYEGILITGPADFIDRFARALALIEKEDPNSWYFVRKHIRKITRTGHPGMDVANGRLMSGDLEGESTASAAGGIIHEAWHRELHFRGEIWRGRIAEQACMERQNAFLRLVGATPLDIEETLSSEYWKVDYWSRDW
jgi:hypothetical protein